jgi:hypothetical protein
LTRQQRPHPSHRLSHSAGFNASSVFRFQKGTCAASLGCPRGFTPRFPRDLSRWAFAPDAAGRLRGEGGVIDFVPLFDVAPTLVTSLWQTFKRTAKPPVLYLWYAPAFEGATNINRWAENIASSPENRAGFARPWLSIPRSIRTRAYSRVSGKNRLPGLGFTMAARARVGAEAPAGEIILGGSIHHGHTRISRMASPPFRRK